MEKKDDIYSRPLEQISGFTFDEAVARVFSDMIRRSVPGYNEILQGISLLTAYHVQPHTRCYDLGSSLGAASLAMSNGITRPGVQIVAVDNSPAMIRESKQYLKNANTPVHLICADFRHIKIVNASVVVLNFTLQFLPPEERSSALQKIFEGLTSGGILIISEKTIFNDPEEQAFQEALHLAFKKAHGYSNLEISQKRSALENVLVPEPLNTHKRRLLTLGFSKCYQWYQNLNFISMVAIK
ncbi:carboxy-S-adenosyl-L-methionine synthase CmoA [Calditrichota bacterium LG25]